MISRSQEPQEKTALKLYSDNGQSQNHSLPRRTLRDCFERYLRGDFLPDQSGTISAYYTALNHWERQTENPDVSEITNETVRRFRDGMLGQGLANDTINKNWRHLRAVFRRIGPWESGNPQAEEIITRPPHMKSLPSRQKISRVVPVELINNIYRACEIAEWPLNSQVPPPALWRCALVLFCNYGMRTFDCWYLNWENISWAENRISFVMQKTKRKLELPLNDVTRMHLRSVQENSPGLFPVTKDRGDLYQQWHLIQTAAGVPIKSEHINFKHLRETCNTWYERIMPGIGQYILGHAAQGVNQRYYLNLHEEIFNAVQQLEQPESFLGNPDDPQLSLF